MDYFINKKRIIFLAIASSSLLFFSYKLWKIARIVHIANISSDSILKLVEKCPIDFKVFNSFPEGFKELKELPSAINNKYCSNFLFSTETTSTQAILETYFESVTSNLLYVAEVQTVGIGRTGKWISNYGCLMFSYKFECDMKYALPIQLIILLAITNSIKAIGISKNIDLSKLQAKWPNDVYLDNRKLGGVLVNSKSTGKNICMSIGIGINVNNVGENISLDEKFLGIFKKGDLLKNYFIEFDKIVNILGKEGWENHISEEYKKVWMHFGKKAVLTSNKLECTITDINHNGFITLCDEYGNTHLIANRSDIEFLN